MARTKLAALPVAIYAAIFVLVNGAYVFFEREGCICGPSSSCVIHNLTERSSTVSRRRLP
jgi:hypothetical protein